MFEDNGDYMFCSVCTTGISEEENLAHYKTEWHKYNVRRASVDLPPISRQFFEATLERVQNEQRLAQSLKNGQVECLISGKTFKNAQVYEHFKTTKKYQKLLEHHNKKKALEAEAGEAAAAESTFNKYEIEYRLPDPEDDQVTPEELALYGEESTSAAEAEAEEGEEDMDDEDFQPGQKAIPLKYSLFDNVGPFKTVKNCLNYMLKNYGFYLPFVDYLIDVEGLLEYLGAKIGIGHECLMCDKRFETTLGCQQHMKSQGHCMFTLYDATEEEEQELMPYYDFSHNLIEDDDDDEEDDEDSMNNDGEKAPKLTAEDKLRLRQSKRLRTLQLMGQKPAVVENVEEVMSTVLTVPTEQVRHAVDLTEKGELVLSDGAVVGVRQNAKNYKLADVKRKQRSTSSYLRNQLINEYYTLSIPGYDVKSKDQKEREKNDEYKQRKREKFLFRNGMNMNMILRKHFVPQVPM